MLLLSIVISVVVNSNFCEPPCTHSCIYILFLQIDIKENSFFENVVSIDRFSNHRTFKKITIPVDPHQ